MSLKTMIVVVLGILCCGLAIDASKRDQRVLMRCEIPNASQSLIDELVPGINDTSECQWVVFYRASLLNIPKKVFELFPKTEVLKFTRASLTIINNGTFEKAYNLKQLDVSNNELQILQDFAFQGASNLTALDLSMNRIPVLSDNTFVGLVNLRFLNLGLNALTTLSVATFKALPSLVIVRAHLNKINHIDVDTFEHLPYLKVIDLALNKLETLELRLNHTDICKVSLTHNLLTSFTMTSTDRSVHTYGKCGLGLILLKNQLTSVTIDSDFHVEELYLGANNISDIKNVKVNEETLEYFHLDDNQIVLKAGDLDKFTNLHKLVISNNHISHIQNETFLNLNKLEELDLSKNEIHVLNFSNFTGLTSLDTLVLDDTEIVKFKYAGIKNVVPKLDTIKLTKTHWTCDFLKKTMDTLKTYQIRLRKVSTVITDPENFNTIAGILCIPDEFKPFSNETIRIHNETELDGDDDDYEDDKYFDLNFMTNLKVKDVTLESGHKVAIVLGTMTVLTLAAVILYLFMQKRINRGSLPGFNRFSEDQNSTSNLI